MVVGITTVSRIFCHQIEVSFVLLPGVGGTTFQGSMDGVYIRQIEKLMENLRE